METPAAACPTCNTPLAQRDARCPSCSASPADAEPDARHASFGAGIVERYRGEIAPGSVKRSSRWLLILAAMYAVLGTMHGLRLHSEAKQVLADLAHYDDTHLLEIEDETYTAADLRSEIRREVWMVFGLNYSMAAAMLALFFWARRNPFHALVTGLCLYLGVIAANAYYDPSTLSKGLLMKAIIIIAMVAAIRLAYAERQEAARLPRATLGAG